MRGFRAWPMPAFTNWTQRGRRRAVSGTPPFSPKRNISIDTKHNSAAALYAYRPAATGSIPESRSQMGRDETSQVAKIMPEALNAELKPTTRPREDSTG